MVLTSGSSVIPGYKFITALCPNLKPTWSKYRCQGSDRLDTVYSQASYRRDTVYSNLKRLRTRKSKLLSEEIFLRSPISEPGCGQFRKQANPGNSPMEALMFWHSMIALANHTLSVALRYHRVHRRIASPAHHPRNDFYKNVGRIWISRQDAPCSKVKTIRLQAIRFEQTYST